MNNVAVIVPTYNGARHLNETLDSIGSQTKGAAEVIVVDDRSTDESATIARAHPSVTKVILLPENAGVCAARNAGIRASRSELIAFCDQDDLWSKDKLEIQVGAMASQPEIDFLFANFNHMRDGVAEEIAKFSEAPAGWWQEALSRADNGVWVFKSPALPHFLTFQPVFPSATIVRRTLLNRVGWFDEALGRERSEDLEFLLRCASVGVIAAVPAPLATVRKHERNYSRDNARTTYSQVKILRMLMQQGDRYTIYSEALQRQIVQRSIIAIDGLFAAREIESCRDLARHVPFHKRPKRQWAKLAIAALPLPAASRIAAVVTTW